MLRLVSFRIIHSSDLRRLVPVTAASGGRAGRTTDAARRGAQCWGPALYITACELAQHPLHLQRLGQRSRRGTAEVPSHHPQAQGQRASGGAEPKPPQSPTSRYRRRSRSSPTQPHTSSTSRRASRGPTKVTTCPGGGVDTGNATTQAPCGVSHTSRLAFELAIKLF